MNYIPIYMDCFFNALESELGQEYYKQKIDNISKQEYICDRIKEIARELVEVTDSNNSIDGRLTNLDNHTHTISLSYDGNCECSSPIYY